MGRSLIDIKGKRFGRLIAIRHRYKISGWECLCDCKNMTVVSSWFLRKNMVKSCGCLNKEMSAARTYKHGWYGTPEYTSWSLAKDRCYNHKNKRFNHYGGRGIEMCKEWKTNFKKFILHVGKKPSPKHSLDRINVNGNYEPGNVRWATPKQQAINTQWRAKKLAAIEKSEQTRPCRNKRTYERRSRKRFEALRLNHQARWNQSPDFG